MDVIGHDYISTDSDVEFFYASKRIFSKRFMRGVKTINFASMESTYRDEKQRRIIGLKNLLQPRRALFDHRASVEAAVSAANVANSGRFARRSRNCGRHGRPYIFNVRGIVGILPGGFISLPRLKTSAADIGNCKSRCCVHRASAAEWRNHRRDRNCEAESLLPCS